MQGYLDTEKSIVISAPAGSGKTEKLAQRYIALLRKGVETERILAITFTEKAAAEMKERILRILQREDKELFNSLTAKLPMMRVTTVHAFCGSLLRRCSFEAGIDPHYQIEDAIESRMVWEDIIYDILMHPEPEDEQFLLHALGERGFRGLDHLKNTLNYLYQKNPFSYEASPFSSHAPILSEAVEKLLHWPNVRETLTDYEEILLSKNSAKWKILEPYFLTGSRQARKRPAKSLKNIPDYKGWASLMHLCWTDAQCMDFAERAKRLYHIFTRCSDRFIALKREKGRLDFSDLEYLAYKMLHEHPEWSNILYEFDEKTDHILVDEFQDTNYFQWMIINKLSEEWRSGIGSKRDKGTRPTVFLVGDDKQSVYYFRGANVELFHKARADLSEWLKDEFQYEEAKENYRSRPAIVEFANLLFSRIMNPADEFIPWKTRYRKFYSVNGEMPDRGRVELVMLDDDPENIAEAKQKEAEILAQRIQGLAGHYEIMDNAGEISSKRKCSYIDMAILLRKRTHLKYYESALRQHNIPFVAVKGIGFYQEPEIAMLRSLVFFLSNPKDDYSLYVLLKSPLFNMRESQVMMLSYYEGRSLFDKMHRAAAYDAKGHTSSVDPISDRSGLKIQEIFVLLEDWLTKSLRLPLAELIEHVFIITSAWQYFHDPQRKANIKKFIRIVENIQSSGRSLIRIREFLESTLNRDEEPKANVNTEGMDAVKIMTIHAAKGLEFPIVFLPGLDDGFRLSAGENLVFERNNTYLFKSVPESSIRQNDEDFLMHYAKEFEEQKRLFYVAVTRAKEVLILLTRWSKTDNSFLGFLKTGLGLDRETMHFGVDYDIRGLSILKSNDVQALYKDHPSAKRPYKKTSSPRVIPIPVKKQTPWRSVTESVEIRSRHGEEWMLLGETLHRIFELVSRSTIIEEQIMHEAQKILAARGVRNEELDPKLKIIKDQIETLKQKHIWQDIICPQKDSFTELPFHCETDDAIYSGRIDRIIMKDDEYRLYDYKTFPVKKNEISYLAEEYAFQISIYKKAAQHLFNTEKITSHLIFTSIGVIQSV